MSKDCIKQLYPLLQQIDVDWWVTDRTVAHHYPRRLQSATLGYLPTDSNALRFSNIAITTQYHMCCLVFGFQRGIVVYSRLHCPPHKATQSTIPWYTAT
ncbi:hypothetical protein J6590_054206 [Homalodisca vitripennis]|nr:hypothetical protein J6590_054206 [Homalodisca vitripennis]